VTNQKGIFSSRIRGTGEWPIESRTQSLTSRSLGDRGSQAGGSGRQRGTVCSCTKTGVRTGGPRKDWEGLGRGANACCKAIDAGANAMMQGGQSERRRRRCDSWGKIGLAGHEILIGQTRFSSSHPLSPLSSRLVKSWIAIRKYLESEGKLSSTLRMFLICCASSLLLAFD
jgi:hypothetical protein